MWEREGSGVKVMSTVKRWVVGRGEGGEEKRKTAFVPAFLRRFSFHGFSFFNQFPLPGSSSSSLLFCRCLSFMSLLLSS